MTEFKKTTYSISGDGFYREEYTEEAALGWADSYSKEGRKNVQVEEITTIRKVIFPKPAVASTRPRLTTEDLKKLEDETREIREAMQRRTKPMGGACAVCK